MEAGPGPYWVWSWSLNGPPPCLLFLSLGAGEVWGREDGGKGLGGWVGGGEMCVQAALAKGRQSPSAVALLFLGAGTIHCP